MRLFLSYAREDLALCERLAAALGGHRIEVLWDRNLSPSLDYSEQIREMIRGADSFAVVLTPDSVSSAECGAEMAYAIELGKRLLPILGDSEIPAEGLPAPIRRAQWCLCSGPNGLPTVVAQIEEALQTNIELVPMHTRLLNRVEEWQARNRDRAMLLPDPFLKEAEDWLMRAALKDQLPQPTDLQREYLSISRAAAIRKAAAFRKWAVAGIAFLAAVLVVISMLYVKADRSEQEANRQATIARANAAEANQQRTNAESSADEANRQRAIAEDNADEANRQRAVAEQNLDEANRQKTIAQNQTVRAETNEDLANRRNRTLLEERGRQELLEGRWDIAAVLLSEAFRTGNDTPALRLMLAAALRPLNGVRAMLPAGDSRITTAAFSADGKRLILGGMDGDATVWATDSGQLAALLTADTAIDEVHLSADGSQAEIVVTEARGDTEDRGFPNVTYRSRASVWDVEQSTLIEEFGFGDYRSMPPDRPSRSAGRPPKEDAEILLKSPDGSKVVIVSRLGNGAMVFTASSRRTQTLAAVPIENASIAFRGASRDLVAVNANGTFRRILTANNHQVTSEQALPHGTEIVLSPEGDSAIVLRDGMGIPVNLNSGSVGEAWTDVIGVRYSTDGGYVLRWSKLSNEGDSFTFWTHPASHLARPAPFQRGTDEKVWSQYEQGIAAVSSRGFVAFADHKVTRVWSSGSDEFPAVAYPVAAEFARDGNRLAVALRDGSILVRDVSVFDGNEIRLQADERPAAHVDFNNDSSRVAIASGDVARIWDLSSASLVTTCNGHRGGVGVARFSGDGTLLATAGSDGTARVWELPSCRELLRFGGHDGGVRDVVFDANATRLATTDRSTVRVFELTRENRPPDAVADLARLSPTCLNEGVLGTWSRPATGSARGTCAAK
jgi:WD40 repeat protein